MASMSVRAQEAVGSVSALPVTSRGRFGISQHAIERCRQRVGTQLSDAGAAALLGRLAAKGRARPTPRRWMRGKVAQTPGLRFIYWSDLPDVCALAVRSTIVTVITRSLYHGRAAAATDPDDLELFA
jgi:hypothetical protein